MHNNYLLPFFLPNTQFSVILPLKHDNYNPNIKSATIMQRAIKLIGLALLYVLAFFIVEVLGAFHPYVWTYSAVPAALVAAWPYYKLCQRYPLPGMAMLCAIMLLMLNFLFGQGHEIFALGCFLFGFIAEGFRKFWGNYRGRKGTIASYVVMALIPFTKTCVWWVDFETVTNMNIYNKRDIYYATLAGKILSFPVLTTMVVLTLVIAFTAMWILTRRWNPREKYNVFIEN